MLVVESNPKSMEAEAYKTLRTNIQYSAIGKKLKTILVTSADSKDGKSTICGNLGLAFSENEQSVIVLDCDFRNPTLHKIFDISNPFGLTDVLAGEVKLEDAVNQYNSNTSVILAGKIPPNPSEILGSEKMKSLLELLSEKFDIVLLDSPPVGVVTDAQVLSTEVDGTVVVVMAEKTKSKRVTEAVNLLKNVDANIVGIVLNGTQDLEKKYKDYYVR